MINDESHLLETALLYEQGHIRRTEHILKVYTLSKLLGEKENLTKDDQIVLHAAAILHDIAIGYCKKHYNGDASQENQQKAAPHLVAQFLTAANYQPCYFLQITDLVLHHHDYKSPRNSLMQILIEADIIINCYENQTSGEKLEYYQSLFCSDLGKQLFTLYKQSHSKKQ